MTALRLAALGTSVDVRPCGPDASAALSWLATELGASLAEVADPEPGTLVVTGTSGAWRVDGEVLAGLGEDGYGTAAELRPLLLAAVTRALLTTTPLLGIHAGVVAAPDGLVVVPGDSGHGKTTLVAALVQGGWGYVSDEVLAVDRADGTTSAFPRPLSLGPQSWRLLGLDPTGLPGPGDESIVEARRLGSVGAATGVGHVLLTRRRPGPVDITAGSPGRAVTALLASAFNHYRAPHASLQAVLRVVRGARVWDVVYDDATELADLMCRNVSQDWIETSAR